MSLFSCQSNSEKKPEILKFEIFEIQDISYSNNSRMVNRIILDVESLLTDKEMRNTAKRLGLLKKEKRKIGFITHAQNGSTNATETAGK